MITAITFQFAYNKKYLNAALQKERILGERNTVQLQEALKEDAVFLSSIEALVTALNKDLLTCDILGVIDRYFPGTNVSVIPKTKHIRTYSFGGLTIHEQDQTYS